MKLFSISGLLFSITLVAMFAALIASQVSNYFLQKENAVLLYELDSCRFRVDFLHKTERQHRLGAAYLIKLSQSEDEWSRFKPFLATIDPYGFEFQKFELEDLEGRSIYCYFEAKYNPNLSERANYNPKSLCLLVNDETLEVVDSMMGTNGLTSLQGSHSLTWENPDGSTTDYKILETGFALDLPAPTGLQGGFKTTD